MRASIDRHMLGWPARLRLSPEIPRLLGKHRSELWRWLGIVGVVTGGAMGVGLVDSRHDSSVRSRPAADPAGPRTPVSGRSNLEGRYVYASPDEGELDVPLTLDMSLPGEFSIQEPSMVAGGARVHVQYSKLHNTVVVDVEAHGLPYRPTFTKAVDDGTTFNATLIAVQDARWQLWLVGTTFGRQHEDLYYSDVIPHLLQGTRYDFPPLGPRPLPEPRGYTLAQASARQMIGSALFEGTPDGELHHRLTLPYDRMTDEWGSAGTINLLVPLEGCVPDNRSNYWTETELPADKRMSWDTFLQSIWSGEGIGFMLTAEPLSRPESMHFRPSTFVGWANVYPAAVPRGFGLDYCTFGTLIPIHQRSYQLSLWPAPSRRKLCRS